MRVENNRVMIYRDGASRWADPHKLPYYQQQGWSLESEPIRAELKPRKLTVVTPEIDSEEPTNTEE